MLKDIFIKEIYGAVFYLFMKDDEFFVDHLWIELIKNDFFILNMQENIDYFINKYNTHLDNILANENNFSVAAVVDEKAPVARYLPSSNPVYTINHTLYKVDEIPAEGSGIKPKVEKITVKAFNEMAHKRDVSNEEFRKNILAKDKILNMNNPSFIPH